MDDVYKASMEGFWNGLDAAEKRYKWLEEHYYQHNDYIVELEKIVQNCYDERRSPTDEEIDLITNYWS